MKDIEYYNFTYMIPKYKIQLPDDFCEYYQTHKDEIIIELDKKTKQQNEEIERLNNIINELEKDIKNLYTYGIKNNAEQRDYLLNRLDGLKELKGNKKVGQLLWEKEQK